MTIKILSKYGGRAGDSFEYRPGWVFRDDASWREYDWLVVYDEMPSKEILACPQAHTILATQEPVSVKGYSGAYVRQFAHYLTNRPLDAEKHPGYFLGRGYYRWYNDRGYVENRDVKIPPKTKVVSTVCSSKQMRHTFHYARLNLVCHLAQTISGFDWFGRGVRPLAKKYEALDPYKYHVVVENHIAPHHWSEKIADALLCECLPFYAGDPLLSEALPPDSYIPIPIDDPLESERIIKEAVAADEYSKRREAILEAKRLLLEKYNFWAQTITVIESANHAADGDAGVGMAIYSRHAIRWRSVSACMEDFCEHVSHVFARRN